MSEAELNLSERNKRLLEWIKNQLEYTEEDNFDWEEFEREYIKNINTSQLCMRKDNTNYGIIKEFQYKDKKIRTEDDGYIGLILFLAQQIDELKAEVEGLKAKKEEQHDNHYLFKETRYHKNAEETLSAKNRANQERK